MIAVAVLFSDEDFSFEVVLKLRSLGNDVLTALQAGLANRGHPDEYILAQAVSLGRIMLTRNRWHFHRLHVLYPNHAGIITCTDDPNTAALANRIHLAIAGSFPLAGQLIRIVRPSKP